MKRSEAIRLMVAFEERAFKRFGHALSRAEVMDGILLQLEKVGMLPPKVRVEEMRKAISPEGEEGTFVSWTYKSVWEPEDEKK